MYYPFSAVPNASNIFVSDTTEFKASVGTSSLHCFRLNSSIGSINLFIIRCKHCFKAGSPLVANHESIKGLHPRSSTFKYIIPARDTVAGDATERSSTSNKRLTCSFQNQTSEQTKKRIG